MSENTRQSEIIAMAAGPETEPTHIAYHVDEDNVWRTICGALEPIWERRVAPEVLDASTKLNLSKTHVPQLDEVTRALKPLSGFEFRAVGGLAPIETFFGSLAKGRFLSTQYIRDASTPFYTEQPDIVHEVIGHATLLASVEFAKLHHLAGAAVTRVETEVARQFIANVWWFSGEFGVVANKDNIKAVGAGLLSSVNELENLDQVKVVPLDISLMGLKQYRVDSLQPQLFAAQSTSQLLDEVGGFFDNVSDGQIIDLTRRIL